MRVRILAALTLVFLAGQATGLAAAMQSHGSEEACSDDDPGGECPPICPSCTCVSHAHPTVLPLRGAPPVVDEPPVVIGFLAVTTFVPSPDPREILHIPKAALTSR